MAQATPFVGRRAEASVLSATFDGTGHGVVLVTGDAGIGKSRLVAEVIAALPDVLVLAGAALPLSESLPYGPSWTRWRRSVRVRGGRSWTAL